MWVFSVPDVEKYLSQKEQVDIISTVFDIWFLVSSPETVILVSSILGRGWDDTAGQQYIKSYCKYLGATNFHYAVDKEKGGADLSTCENTLFQYPKSPRIVVFAFTPSKQEG